MIPTPPEPFKDWADYATHLKSLIGVIIHVPNIDRIVQATEKEFFDMFGAVTTGTWSMDDLEDGHQLISSLATEDDIAEYELDVRMLAEQLASELDKPIKLQIGESTELITAGVAHELLYAA